MVAAIPGFHMRLVLAFSARLFCWKWSTMST